MNLKHRFLLVSGISTLLVALVLFVSGQFAQQRADERYGAISNKSVRMVWDAAVDGHLDQMVNNVFALTRDSNARKALIQKDRNALAESIKTTYIRLSTLGVLSKIDIFDARGNLLLSMPHSDSDISHMDSAQRFRDELGVDVYLGNGQARMLQVSSVPLVESKKPP